MQLMENDNMPQLEDYKRLVHDKGFNISMLINTYKRKQRDRKSTYEIPDEVYVEVCKEFLKCKEIEHPWPYFMKVLVLKSQDHCASRTIKYAGENRFGEMPENIRSIMNNA